jgi:YD repeat-containing protein
MTFDGVATPNRVDGIEGLPGLNKFRLSTVRNESGGDVQINYAPTDCVRTALPAQHTNAQRCFPSWWAPPGEGPQLDWFHKYVVRQVLARDLIAGAPAVETDYDYDGGAAWHYTDADEITLAAKRTWSQWRGYQRVTVTQGDPNSTRSATSYLYLRGMNGDKLPAGTRSVTVTDSQGGTITDSPALAGFVREQTTTNGVDGPEISGQVNDPYQAAVTATHAHDGLTVEARIINTAGERGRTRLATGAFRHTRLTRTFDAHGQIATIDDQGDTSIAEDDLCTRTDYASNATRRLFSYPSRVATVGVACAATPSYPTDAVSDVRSYYDLSTALGALPGAGDVTRTEQVASYTGDTPVYAPVASGTFDGFGRPLSAKDALGRETKTVYTDTNGLTTKTVVTDPATFVVTTTVDPSWGVPITVSDINAKTTELAYDPLGRLTGIWKPSRPRASFPATIQYAYSVRADAASSVTTSTLGPNGRYTSEYLIYDGLLRQRQTQAPAVGEGRILADTTYDSRGLVFRANGAYVAAGTAGTALSTVDDNQVPTQTLSRYDGAGRPTASIFQSFGVEQWRTTTAYGGDHVDVTPPAGGTATSTYTDARGQKREFRQYHAASPGGPFDSTKYAYTDAGLPATITDPAGNIWSYGYDPRGRQITSDDPDRGHSTTTYDDAGQQLTNTDSRGSKLAYSYDVLGRRTGEFQDSTRGRSWPAGPTTRCARAR